MPRVPKYVFRELSSSLTKSEIFVKNWTFLPHGCLGIIPFLAPLRIQGKRLKNWRSPSFRFAKSFKLQFRSYKCNQAQIKCFSQVSERFMSIFQRENKTFETFPKIHVFSNRIEAQRGLFVLKSSLKKLEFLKKCWYFYFLVGISTWIVRRLEKNI